MTRPQDTPSLTLAERFGIPPFSVFNAREGWWQDRKRAWIDLGIRSELGRGAPIGGAPLPMDRAKADRRARRFGVAGDRLFEIESARRWSRQADQWLNESSECASFAQAVDRMENLTFVKGSRDPKP